MKLFLIKLGMVKESDKVHELMFKSFRESTDTFTQQIIQFLQKHLCTNKTFFNETATNVETKVNDDAKTTDEVDDDVKAKIISRYLRTGSKKSEILVNKVIENDNNEGNNTDEEMNEEKYETKDKKGKNNNEGDNNSDNDNSEKEELSDVVRQMMIIRTQ